MKRKLIEYEVFNKMRENSLSTAVNELAECEDYLASALNKDGLTLESFDEATVIYQTNEGTFVRANYQLENQKVKFNNIEELVINEETERKESRKAVEGLLEALLNDDGTTADKFFAQYMEMSRSRYKRNGTLCTDSKIEESYVRIYGTRGKGGQAKVSNRVGGKDPKRSAAAKKAHRLHPGSYRQGGKKRSGQVAQERQRRQRYKRDYGKLKAISGGNQYSGRKHRMVNEWATLASNVMGFVDFKENGYVVSQTQVKLNEHGDVTSVTLPDAKTRNEGKVQQQKYKNMVAVDWKVLRENARRLASDQNFCHAVAEIKRYNNISDNKELEESIGGLVTKHPSVLYLTQEELSRTIGSALENLGVSNYDDTTCNFMAEGILRMAHNAYSDRVDKILQYTNKATNEGGDSYLQFQSVIKDFFPGLDESIDLERKVFEDLYSAANQIRSLALESNNEMVRNEAHEFISDLEAVLSGRSAPDIELAEEVAGWLNHLAETNMGGDSWEVVKTPYQTVTGDHPQMAKNAKMPGIPGQNEGDWGDPAPMLDGEKKSYKNSGAPEEARHRSWGNKGGRNVWPDLNNPNIPNEFGDKTMKGDKGADKDSDGLGVWDSKDLFPSLQNPYVPDSVKVHVNSDNRVDDRSN